MRGDPLKPKGAGWDWALGLLVALVGAVVAAPALAPGVEAYIDNAPHLVELAALTREILPVDHWFSGWTNLAEAGFATGQVNAPLAWVGLALAVQAGADPTRAYLAAIPLSNAVLAWGVFCLGRALLAQPRAAVLAAVLAASSLWDLYDIAGAAGGMWPFRLGMGMLCWGMARRWKSPLGGGIWLATLLLTHTYVGMLGFAWMGLEMLATARERRLPWRPFASAVLGALLSAPFWWPLLDGRLRDFGRPQAWDAALLFGYLAVPARIIRYYGGGGLAAMGGSAGVAAGLLCWVGALGLFRRTPHQLADRELAAKLAIAMITTLTLVLLIHGITRWSFLGPNPWRYLAFPRIGLALLAGAGLASLGRAPALLAGLLATVLALRVGLRELPTRASHPADWTALEQSWDRACAAANGGRIYADDTAFDAGNRTFSRGHAHALLALHCDSEVLGSWYRVTPNATTAHLDSARDRLFGRALEKLDGPALDAAIDAYAITVILSSSEPTTTFLSTQSRLIPLTHQPPYAVFWVLGPMPQLTVTGGAAHITAANRDDILAEIDTPGPSEFRFSRGYHPWWHATQSGIPVPLKEDPNTGLIVGLANPGPVHLWFATQ